MQRVLLPCNDQKPPRNCVLQYPFRQRSPGYLELLSGSTNKLANIFLISNCLQKELSIKVQSAISKLQFQ